MTRIAIIGAGNVGGALYRSLKNDVGDDALVVCDTHDALLVYDEVQTGLGMTGEWWAYQHHGVQPDILCFGKKMQLCGIFASKRLDEVHDNVFHKPGRINSTWGGNLVDMVRATRILEIMVDEGLVANARARGAELLKGLEAIEQRHPIVTNARGAGLMCALDLPDTARRNAVIKSCFEAGMIVLACGSRSVRFRPTLTVDAEIIAEGVRRLEAAIVAVGG